MATKKWIAKRLEFALKCETKEDTDHMIGAILTRMNLTDPTFEEVWEEVSKRVPSMPAMKNWVKETTKLVLEALDEISEQEDKNEQS